MDERVLLGLHNSATWFMVGIIWLVQWVHYPMFRYLDRATFRSGHAFHSRAIGMIVAPVMLLELASAATILWTRGWDGPAVAGFALLAVIWACTFLVMVPLHGRLNREGFRTELHTSLLRWNWIRTVSWSLRGAIAAALL